MSGSQFCRVIALFRLVVSCKWEDIVRKILSKYGYQVTRRKECQRSQFYIDRSRILLNRIERGAEAVILDVGAHIGESLKDFKKLFPNSEIHCFEPNQKSYSLLQRQAKAYRKVYLNDCALGNIQRQVDFYSSNYTDMSSVVPINVDSGEFKFKNSSIEYRMEQVPMTTIDAYSFDNGIERIDILKLDVQGFEPECLQGARRMLKEGRILNILVEIMFHDAYARRGSFFEIESQLPKEIYRLGSIFHIKWNPANGAIRMLDVAYFNLDADHANL